MHDAIPSRILNGWLRLEEDLFHLQVLSSLPPQIPICHSGECFKIITYQRNDFKATLFLRGSVLARTCWQPFFRQNQRLEQTARFHYNSRKTTAHSVKEKSDGRKKMAANYLYARYAAGAGRPARNGQPRTYRAFTARGARGHGAAEE